MRIHSTVLLLIVAALPVAAAFRTRPQIGRPPAPTLPVSWVRVQFDSMSAPTTSLVVHGTGERVALSGHTRIVRSTDGGSTWRTVHVAPRSLHRLAFNGSDIGIAVGDRLLLRTVDGGASWAVARMPVPFNGHGVAFTSPADGYVVGGIGQLLRTRDAGASWEYVTLPARTQLNAIAVVDATTLVIVGSEGGIWRSQDRGGTWQRVTTGTTQHLSDVAFMDAQRGVAVGMWGTVLLTADGGHTWTPGNAGTQAHFAAVTFDAHGVAIAADSDTIMVRRLPNAH